MIRILHIIDKITGAGPTRSLITLAETQRRLRFPYEHTVITLEREAYPYTLIMAKRAGMRVTLAPTEKEIGSLISTADIVQVHFWNNPALYDFLRGDWPALRLLLRLHVVGTYPPLCLTPSLVDFADHLVPSTKQTLTMAEIQNAKEGGNVIAIPASAGFDRLDGFQKQSHQTFNIGYIGTVNFNKMHPEFAVMSAAVGIKDSRFIICGGTDKLLQQQIEQLRIDNRFVFHGFVENIRSILETLDVFGYPLRSDTCATSELSLQEAMAVGIPPVVFPYSGLKYLVEDGHTGIVVNSVEEYSRAINYLYQSPEERGRIGQNARDYARDHFNPVHSARQFDEQYQQLMTIPKQKRVWPGVAKNESAALRFIDALGDHAPQFSRSMKAANEEAESQIASSSQLLVRGEGGVFQYRNAYPDDAFLCFWSGLILLKQQRYVLAAREFEAAVEMGLDPARCSGYLAVAKGHAKV